MNTDYIDEIEKISNKEKVGLATHQNQSIFPINKTKNAAVSGFLIKVN